MRASIEKVDIGLAPDQANVVLPDGIFTDSRNVRYRDGGFEKIRGTEAVFGSLSLTAIWAGNIQSGSESFWVYASQSVVFATDGTTHAQISSATYAAAINLGYTGGNYHGFMVMNDAEIEPQTWDPDLSNKLVPLTGWPASTTCDVIRPFGDFLVALRLTESAVANPRIVRWSDIGGVGALPTSWDFTDPTNSAGRTELGDTSDELIDCLPLRDNNIVYKQFNTYLMQNIGGLDVFVFRRIFEQSGLLTENCVKSFGSYHYVVTDHDVIIHDGATIQSLADKRLRRWLFGILNPDRYDRSFVVPNYREKIMRFCFPESGHDFPNLSLDWDWSNNTFHVSELGGNIAHAATGVVTVTTETYATITGTFDDLMGNFSDSSSSPFAERPVLFDSEAAAAYETEMGETLNGVPMSLYAIRDNIGLTKDVGQIKRIQRVYPKVYGTAGDILQVYIGTRNTPNEMVTYSGPFNFTVGVDYKIDCRVSGRFITTRFVATITHPFRCAGFDIEFENDGYR